MRVVGAVRRGDLAATSAREELPLICERSSGALTRGTTTPSSSLDRNHSEALELSAIAIAVAFDH
jgi:hypothetical protein